MMSVWKCNECNRTMGTGRFLCPKCGSENIIIIDEKEGICDFSWALYSTPEGFPEKYFIVIYSTTYKTRGFCISQEKMERGSRIRVFRKEGKIFCELQ